MAKTEAKQNHDPEHDLLMHTLSWTPEERMNWLEDALNFALEAGALEKTRALEEAERAAPLKEPL